MDRRLAGLDARCIRLHDLPPDHGADLGNVPRAADRSHGRLHHHTVAAAGGRGWKRLARRPHRAQSAADDLDPVVFGLQPVCRHRTDLLAAVPVPGAARHRHGRRVACRFGTRHGILADTLARPDERRAAGFLASSLAYGLLYDHIGWRGLLILGVLPALAVVWIRFYVKEPAVWVENRRIQREQNKEFKAPLLDIFRLRILPNTLMTCLWMAS